MKPQLGIILLLAFSTACTFSAGAGSKTASSPGANTATTNNNPVANRATAPADNAGSASDDPNAEDEKIQFVRGETATTLERTIAPGVNKMYLFNARKGQIIWFKVTESTNQLDVSFNKYPAKLGEEVREVLNASGDWAIYVSNPTQKQLKYTLWLGIE